MNDDLSLQPDPHMRWIYAYNDPRYNDPETRGLRDRRWEALRAAPQWAHDLAFSNDMRRKNERNDLLRSQGRMPEL